MTSGDPGLRGAGLLRPGAHRAAGVADDAAVFGAMVRVEVAWLRSLATADVNKSWVTVGQVDAVAAAVAGWQPNLAELAAQGELVGNPVVPMLRVLKARLAEPAAVAPAAIEPETVALVHRGLTSQDVLDTALMLVAKTAVQRIKVDLFRLAETLATLSDEHRDSLMVGRTLTQYAVPITFGLKSAQWLAGVLDACDHLDSLSYPAQVGGAAGTLSLLADLVTDPQGAASEFAASLGLDHPDLPWHTRRNPVTRIADALVEVTDSLGVIASNVALLGRPEIDELSEGASPGRGGSSTMPHKQNPVLSVLIRSSALQAPMLAAQVHLAAANNVDERPDGAWQAEWSAYQQLLTLALTAASQTRELIAGLEVNVATMRNRANANAAALLAERRTLPHRDGATVPSGADPATYVGAAHAFVDAVLRRHRRRNADD